MPSQDFQCFFDKLAQAAYDEANKHEDDTQDDWIKIGDNLTQIQLVCNRIKLEIDDEELKKIAKKFDECKKDLDRAKQKIIAITDFLKNTLEVLEGIKRIASIAVP